MEMDYLYGQPPGFLDPIPDDGFDESDVVMLDYSPCQDSVLNGGFPSTSWTDEANPQPSADHQLLPQSYDQSPPEFQYEFRVTTPINPFNTPDSSMCDTMSSSGTPNTSSDCSEGINHGPTTYQQPFQQAFFSQPGDPIHHVDPANLSRAYFGVSGMPHLAKEQHSNAHTQASTRPVGMYYFRQNVPFNPLFKPQRPRKYVGLRNRPRLAVVAAYDGGNMSKKRCLQYPQPSFKAFHSSSFPTSQPTISYLPPQTTSSFPPSLPTNSFPYSQPTSSFLSSQLTSLPDDHYVIGHCSNANIFSASHPVASKFKSQPSILPNHTKQFSSPKHDAHQSAATTPYDRQIDMRSSEQLPEAMCPAGYTDYDEAMKVLFGDDEELKAQSHDTEMSSDCQMNDLDMELGENIAGQKVWEEQAMDQDGLQKEGQAEDENMQQNEDGAGDENMEEDAGVDDDDNMGGNAGEDGSDDDKDDDYNQEEDDDDDEDGDEDEEETQEEDTYQEDKRDHSELTQEDYYGEEEGDGYHADDWDEDDDSFSDDNDSLE